MLQERIEAKWIDAFEEVFDLCAIAKGTTVAILSETQSRPVNVQLAELALLRMGAKAFHLTMPTPALSSAAPLRSTGASLALQQHPAALAALTTAEVVIDLTVEGLLHAPELPTILKSGARVLMVSNEHPEILERLRPDPSLEPKVKAATKMLKAAKSMLVTSEAGTDLIVDLEGAPCAGVWGYTAKPGTIAHWPGGIAIAFPKQGSVNGQLVLDAGDINLTFKRYLESPVVFTIENDFVESIDGKGLDVELFRSYFSAWGDRNAYATSHVGWGMAPGARWDAMVFYDKSQTNCIEQRAFAGNFLYSTGANEFAGRYTEGHFDLPMRNCTISLDGTVVVDQGVLQGELA